MRRALLLIAPLATACTQGTPASSEPIQASIAEIRASPDKFDKRHVIVRGWLKKCEELDCWLVEQATSNPLNDLSPYLSIGYDASFDAKVAQYLPAQFELEAIVSAECLRKGTFCLDRAEDLHSVKILNVLSPKATPSQERH